MQGSHLARSDAPSRASGFIEGLDCEPEARPAAAEGDVHRPGPISSVDNGEEARAVILASTRRRPNGLAARKMIDSATLSHLAEIKCDVQALCEELRAMRFERLEFSVNSDILRLLDMNMKLRVEALEDRIEAMEAPG